MDFKLKVMGCQPAQLKSYNSHLISWYWIVQAPSNVPFIPALVRFFGDYTPAQPPKWTSRASSSAKVKRGWTQGSPSHTQDYQLEQATLGVLLPLMSTCLQNQSFLGDSSLVKLDVQVSNIVIKTISPLKISFQGMSVVSFTHWKHVSCLIINVLIIQ